MQSEMKNMKLLLIDNFDSFVYNLYQYLAELGHEVQVLRNNEITIEEISSRKYDGIVISPGPGNPDNEKDFGICKEVIRMVSGVGRQESGIGGHGSQVICQIPDTEYQIPILGVCLGHQGIISAFGGKIIRAKKPMHGKTSTVRHNGKGIFTEVKNPLTVMRYHSLIGDESSLPDCLEITARSEDDNAIMAVQHKTLPVFGVQFHPESIMTEEGKRILRNFCDKVSAIKH